jgi:hypothetical protein
LEAFHKLQVSTEVLNYFSGIGVKRDFPSLRETPYLTAGIIEISSKELGEGVYTVNLTLTTSRKSDGAHLSLSVSAKGNVEQFRLKDITVKRSTAAIGGLAEEVKLTDTSKDFITQLRLITEQTIRQWKREGNKQPDTPELVHTLESMVSNFDQWADQNQVNLSVPDTAVAYDWRIKFLMDAENVIDWQTKKGKEVISVSAYNEGNTFPYYNEFYRQVLIEINVSDIDNPVSAMSFQPENPGFYLAKKNWEAPSPLPKTIAEAINIFLDQVRQEQNNAIRKLQEDNKESQPVIEKKDTHPVENTAPVPEIIESKPTGKILKWGGRQKSLEQGAIYLFLTKEEAQHIKDTTLGKRIKILNKTERGGLLYEVVETGEQREIQKTEIDSIRKGKPWNNRFRKQ